MTWWPVPPQPKAVRERQMEARKQARNVVILIIVDHFLDMLRPRGIVLYPVIIWPNFVKVNANLQQESPNLCWVRESAHILVGRTFTPRFLNPKTSLDASHWETSGGAK